MIMDLGCNMYHVVTPYVSRRKNGSETHFSYFACHVVSTQWPRRGTLFSPKIKILTP